MGCIQSHNAEPLLRPTLPVIYDDRIWGPVYMSSDLSKYIRNTCVGMHWNTIKTFMLQFPQLTYEIGSKDLAYKRVYNSPNHIRFCVGPDDNVLLIIYG
jgi:hypothetical protein